MIAAVHLLLTGVCLITSVVLGAPRFDNPDYPEPSIERVADAGTIVLVQPGKVLLDFVGYANTIPYLDWIALFMNSLIWSLPITIGVAYLTQRSTTTRKPAGRLNR